MKAGAALEANDGVEAERAAAGQDSGGRRCGDIAQKLAVAKRKLIGRIWRNWRRAVRRNCRDPRRCPIVLEDPPGGGGLQSSQVAVDDEHKPIAASEVVNDGNDTGH
ncbi:hypothetical protein ACTGJ9_038160 [Bradyrhizobium sp. RDM12]